jgi:hypothetical protein
VLRETGALQSQARLSSDGRGISWACVFDYALRAE